MLSSTCKSWVQSAQQDFIVIDSLMEQVRNPRLRPHEQVLYHSQQAAEKMLKAYLVHKGITPWGHILIELRRDCATFDVSFNQKRIIDHCAFLTIFNTVRYPDFVAYDIDATLAARGLNSAKRIYDFVSIKLDLGKKFFI